MHPHPKKPGCSFRSCLSQITFKTTAWWLLLLTMVLAIPAFAIILTTTINSSGITEIVLFIAACWLCIYIGMHLIKHSPLTPIIFEHVALSESSRQRCINMISMIESEMAKWKQRYLKCESVFMNLAKQPAWDYLDEITQILGKIKSTADSDSTITFAEIKALHAWIESAKPTVIDGYLHTLESIYSYAKAEFSQQGKNIDELFPELGKGHMDTIVNAPSYAKNFAQELLDTIRKEHPVLARTDLRHMPLA